MKKLHFFLLILIITFSQSCRKDIDNIEITPPNIPPITYVISSIHGTVVDKNGDLVNNATVTFQDDIVLSDENGVFQFKDKKLNSNGTFVTVEKDGFFKGSRRFYPSAGNTSLIDVELIPLEISGSFNSNSQATINHDNVVLNFPQNAIVNQDGTSYNGIVNVAVAYLDPTNPNTLAQMPGDLTGISNDEALVALKSLGMIAVELMDENGNELQVKEGNLVDVNIPIPTELQTTAPATIPMWHFDEISGIWEEEGLANLVDDHYETSLPHFSFWNCDIPNDYVFVDGTILNRGAPVQGITVMILDPDNNTSGYGVTDQNGQFSGFIPNNEELTLVILSNCDDVFYSSTLTTTDEDITLAPIDINFLIDYSNINGSVSYCSEGLSEYAYVVVKSSTSSYTFPILENDTFLGSINYCESGDQITVTAFDPINNITSGEYIFEIEGDIELGNIELCEIDFVEHLIIEFGETKFNIPFDDKLINLFFRGEDVLTLGDEGFFLKSIYEPESDSIVIFKFYVNYDEGSPFQPCRIEYHETEGVAGNGASGICSSQLVTKDGIEYLHSTGTVSEASGIANLDNQPMYFDILIKTQ